MNNLGTKLFILSITYSVYLGNIYIWHPKNIILWRIAKCIELRIAFQRNY